MKRFYPSKLSVLIPFLGLMLFMLDGYSQGVVNDGAKVSLSAGTYVTIGSGSLLSTNVQAG